MPWSTPENLGPVVNSPFNDYLAMLSLDGRTLVMVSDRPEGFGGNDLYIATRSRRVLSRTVSSMKLQPP